MAAPGPKLGGWDFYRQVLKSPRLVVAPMVDQSALAWRMLSRAHKAELCYTPMLHSAVFCRNPQYRAEQFTTCPEDRPLIVQFCANDPQVLLEAAKHVEDHCDAVDLNLGCPQLIAKRGHYGSFLMEEWDLIASMISLLHKELKVAVTAKIRVFDDLEKTIRYAKMIEAAGAQILTVHGRTRDMKGHNTGLASWDIIKAVREAVNIPVFANGNILYKEDIDRCLEYTGCAGLMTAEANLYDPALFEGVHYPVWQLVDEYMDLCRKYTTPTAFIRSHLFKLYHHALPLHIDLRQKLAEASTFADYEAVCTELNARLRRIAAEHESRGTVPPDPEDTTIDIGKALVSAPREYPYWIAHAKVRPLETMPETKRKACELDLDNEQAQKDREALLQARLERKMRKRKKFEIPSVRAKMCSVCFMNQPGRECKERMCKACCVKHALVNSIMCEAHGKAIRKAIANGGSPMVDGESPSETDTTAVKPDAADQTIAETIEASGVVVQ